MDSILERWTRVFLAIFLFFLATGLYYAWKTASGAASFSIIDRLRGKTAGKNDPPISYTTATDPIIALDDVQLLSRLNAEYSSLIQAVTPSVVSINTAKSVNVSRYYYNLFGVAKRSDEELKQPAGLGSGVIVTKEGHLLTNHHLIADVSEILVTLHGERRYKATLVGSDPRADLAVLKITGGVSETFPALRLGNSDAVKVGEMVFAVGNPFGLNETVTQGIISAKERRLTDADTGFFQTDTVINPGSSGGPLINLRGEVIGINVYIYAGQQGLRTWQGIGLAIPSNDVAAVFNEIMTQGRPSRGYLGVGVEDVFPDDAVRLGLKTSRGAVIQEVVPDSPAAAAGLQPDDVIVSLDGTEMENTTAVIQEVRRHAVGQPVRIGLIRGGAFMEIEARIGERSTEVPLATKPSGGEPGRPISKILGVEVADLSGAEKEALGLHPESPAVIIKHVKPGSPAENSMQVGDLIHEVDRQPIHTAEEFVRAIDGIPMNRTSALHITRNGARAFVILEPRNNGAGN